VGRPIQIRPLLALDVELGARLTAAERADAAQLGVHVARPSPGAWTPPDAVAGPAGGTATGVLVNRGLIVHETHLAGTVSAEILAPGDVVLDTRTPEGYLLAGSTWWVLVDAEVALLERRVLRQATRWPAVVEALIARSAERAARLSVHQAIAKLPRVDLRLLAVLWHLAERAGRVTPQGVVLAVPLTHELLGRLVGARRPTVSLALKELDDAGHVHRLPDGEWQLSHAMPDLDAVAEEGEAGAG
jgi:hypothetical protein